MTDRLTIDQINSDQLDALYAEIDRLTAELADYDKRVQTLEHVAAGNKRHVQLIVPDLERAEATIARVRALHRDWEADPGHCAHCQDGMGTPLPWPCPTITALDETPPDQLP